MDAIAAVFADAKSIKTRSVYQLIFEIDIAQADAALQYLGGIPQPGNERWAVIARLTKKFGGDRELLEKRSRDGDATGITASPFPPDADGAPRLHSERGTILPVTAAPAPSDDRPPRTDGKECVKRAGMYCRQKEFHDWLRNQALKKGIGVGELKERPDECARLIHAVLGVDSRAEFAHDDAARQRFLMLEAAYLQHAGLMAEKVP